MRQSRRRRSRWSSEPYRAVKPIVVFCTWSEAEWICQDILVHKLVVSVFEWKEYGGRTLIDQQQRQAPCTQSGG